MATEHEWARAFAKQALADFDTWNALQSHLKPPEGTAAVPRCQKLHFLQMACEKLAKAHLLKGGVKLSDLEQKHTYVAKHLPTIVRQQMFDNGEKKRVADWVRDQCKRIAREIELLSPAVRDGGRREDNCEYPWQTGGSLYIPAEWSFSNLSLLFEPAGTNILKRTREAILRLAK